MYAAWTMVVEMTGQKRKKKEHGRNVKRIQRRGPEYNN